MQCVSLALGFFWFIFILNWGSSSNEVYDKKCNHSSECAVYLNVSQGPDVIWIPLFCNEKNFCACPNGWTPLSKDNDTICIARLSGSLTEDTCTAYIWAISLFVVILLVLITYSCISLFSKRSHFSQSIKNHQHLPTINS